MSHELWRRAIGDYRGLAMRCSPGTHEAVAAMIRARVAPSASVLDLAAGSGALLARLRDAGYSDLSAVELDAGKFGVAGVEPMRLDLNADFAAKVGRTFDLVTAVEIVEHLDSPRHFLAQIRSLLADDGLLVLSTPNVAHWVGRVRFLLSGTLRFFDDAQYAYNHHVSPLPAAQLRHLLAEVGYRIERSETAGNFFGPLKTAALSPVWLPFRAACGPSVTGDVNVYLLAQAEPRRSRAGDWTEAGGETPSNVKVRPDEADARRDGN